MTEKKRIACFFTAGYTELNAMKTFMKKINNTVEYIQLCPIGPRKSRRGAKDRHIDQIEKSQSGLTGKGLIDFINYFIGQKRFEEEGYDAILIEDDKDDRFLSLDEDGTSAIDKDQWEEFKKDVTERIREKRPDIPVIFFYAAPEVETWFLADWEKSFGTVYKEDMATARQNDYFNVRFRKYVNDNILTGRYKDRIEEYGYFGGEYRKLSEEIQNALGTIDFLNDYIPDAEHPAISYSKRRQGGDMLERIVPETVLHNCPFFFKDGYMALRALASV